MTERLIMDKSKSVLKREAVQQEQVNSGHFLELMDRLHVVICILELAQEKLSEAYCLGGKAENAMLSAYKPQSDDMRKDAERWRTFREIASEEMCYALCGNSNADNDELDQAVDKIRE